MLYGLVTPKHLREESPQRLAGRVLGVCFGLVIFAMGIRWRWWLDAHGIPSGNWDLVVSAFGLMIGTTFVIRRPFLMRAVLLATGPLLLYLLAAEGPPKWAGYGYLGALMAAVMVHRGTRYP